jgi:hypothetical protein
MNFTIPKAIKEEHDELHAELASAIKCGGKTGSAASVVAELMHPHFVKEEEYALPPLGLLDELSAGRIDRSMRDVLVLTDRLKSELSSMLEEHKAIVAALETLTTSATEEAHPEIAAFASKLIHHAVTEEQVMYPAALLVGEYVRAKLET